MSWQLRWALVFAELGLQIAVGAVLRPIGRLRARAKR